MIATPLQTTQVNVVADVINFGIGQPSFELLPTEMMQRAAEHRLSQRDATYLNYGFEQGDGYLREALAAFLASEYRLPVDATSLMITGGASQAIDMVCNTFTRPGDVIFVEEPTFFLILNLFRDYDLTVIPIPVSAEGIDFDVLEHQLTKHQPKFFYTIPAFQNPTGRTMPSSQRKNLMSLSQEYNFLILADEVYQLLHYSEQPPAPYAGMIEAGNFLSVGSFSKILAPGLRCGWIQTSPQLMRKLLNTGLAASGGGNNHFTSGIVRSVIEMGEQQKYLCNLRSIYAQRVAVLDAALRAHLPTYIYFERPSGGYFFWLEMPADIDAVRLLEQATKHQVGFQPGVRFSSCGNLSNYIRLSFAFYNEDELREGAARLALVVKSW